MDFLYKYAEILNVNMPLRSDLVSVINDIKRIKMEKYELDEKVKDMEGENMETLEDLETLLDEEEDEVAELIEEVSTGSCFEGLKSMLKPINFQIADEVDYFSAIFRKDKLDFFDIYSEENPNGKPIDQFFSDIDRIRMVSYALTQAQYGKKKDGKSAGYGIKRLLNQKVFLAAYPVHDGGYEQIENEKPSMRSLLHSEWARKHLLTQRKFFADLVQPGNTGFINFHHLI